MRCTARRNAQATKLAAVHAARVTTVRQLAHARRRAAAVAVSGASLAGLLNGRSAASCRVQRPDLIDRYLDYGSAGWLVKGGVSRAGF